jgi:2-C-methyl-D-erythritol 4-phosphate cytidylyltransferase
MKKIAVIVGGGSGSRMKTDIPKQFLLLKEKPILFYTIDSFLKAFADFKIILVLPADYIEQGNQIIQTYFPASDIQIVAGGATRFHSVQNGLSCINEEAVVFVHDAVRCLVSEDLITRAYESTVENGSAIPVVSSKDSVRMIQNNNSKIVDRSTIKLVQTPQVFLSSVLLPAFKLPFQEDFTDEASVVEHFGHTIHLIEGEETNIKITHPIDLIIAEKTIDSK